MIFVVLTGVSAVYLRIFITACMAFFTEINAHCAIIRATNVVVYPLPQLCFYFWKLASRNGRFGEGFAMFEVGVLYLAARIAYAL